MATGIVSGSAAFEETLRECAVALQSVAGYRLPPPIDRRLTDLAENKDQLTETEKSEFLALFEFAEGRTIEKLRATSALRHLAAQFPDIVGPSP